MRVPLKPPPPYCTERPFHSTGRFTSSLIGGALVSVGSIWPSTLQNAGLAGAIRAAGVGARSDTASGEGVCSVTESIRTASEDPARPPQAEAASSIIIAAAGSALMVASRLVAYCSARPATLSMRPPVGIHHCGDRRRHGSISHDLFPLSNGLVVDRRVECRPIHQAGREGAVPVLVE